MNTPLGLYWNLGASRLPGGSINGEVGQDRNAPSKARQPSTPLLSALLAEGSDYYRRSWGPGVRLHHQGKAQSGWAGVSAGWALV